MKKLIFICLITLIVGCQKQPELVDQQASAKFEEADQQVTSFLDLLDDPEADKDKQKEVLCVKYPKVYEQEYMPALLKLSHDYTADILLGDLKVATDYYKEKLEIVCD
ncbi:MAG: hypothetical protein KAZ18_00075 [Acinetobacter sp.]|nr:hypothetical protein [Acinetobacter sp.]